MRIAYVILAHQLPEQLGRLVRRLNTPGATFLIHVSRRSVREVYGEAKATLDGFDNVTFLRFFRHVDVPDECIFHTILVNSPLRESLVNDDLRYVDWTRTPLPAILGVQDLDALARSSKLFARKFDQRVDAEILDLIDARLLAPERQPG